MKRTPRREQDHAFGQHMLTLRTAIGLSQEGLAAFLGVSRHAVGSWETGRSYPKTEYLKSVIALGLQQHAFSAGREAEEIRTLWRLARQKVLLDEQWLQQLLGRQQALPAAPPPETSAVTPLSASGGPQVDWDNALDIPGFYGRDEELALLSHWLVAERCRVVSVLGLGGVGKSTLATRVMREVAPHFDVVIWRSVRDAPHHSTVPWQLIEASLHQSTYGYACGSRGSATGCPPLAAEWRSARMISWSRRPWSAP